MTRTEKIAVFEPTMKDFETNHIKAWCLDMIAQIPDYIFEIPSSLTGKYHNRTQCQEHGQVYHIIMFAAILNYRLGLKGNREKFKSPEQRDCMRCVPYLHDALKCGWDHMAYTVHEHPLLAAEWVMSAKTEHQINDKSKKAIANMCASHSGEWTTAKKGSKVILPEPSNSMELFCHECDYLSSRADIDMIPPDYLKDVLVDEPVEFDESYVMPFGKYQGELLLDIYRKHPDYVEWMENNIHKRDVLKMIKAMKEVY